MLIIYREVLLCLALCDEAIREPDEDKSTYKSASCDEVCLLDFAKSCGYEYMGLE